MDRGLKLVADEQETIRKHVEEIKKVSATLNPTTGNCRQRRRKFQRLKRGFAKTGDAIHAHMSSLMSAFQVGLFAGGDELAEIQDNLDLERFFRLPKSHERRIHGHRHAGVRIVQEGPTLVPVLDAHHSHPEPFAPEDLMPYRRPQNRNVNDRQ